MKILCRSLLIQFLIIALVQSPLQAQEIGTATQDIADRQKYQDFVHQDTINKYNEACQGMEGHCGPNPVSSDNGIDVVNSFVAQLAMGLLVGGGIGSLVTMKKGDFQRDAAADKENFSNKLKKVSDKKGVESSEYKELDKKFNDKYSKESTTAETTNTETGSEAQSTDAEEGGTDLGKICKMVATAGMLGLTLSELLSKNGTAKKYSKTQTEIAQADALYNIANTHEDKRKSNVAQGSIFSVITACFGTAAAIEYAKYNPGKGIEYTIYAGLAGTLSTLSFISAGRHGEIRDKAETAAKQIPNKGDCHPGTPCFCTENREISKKFHSSEFEKNCIDDSLARGDTRNIAMSCIDARGNPDLACNCRKTNSCFDSTLRQQIQEIKMDPNLRDQMNDTFKVISQGQLSEREISRIGKIASHYKNVAEKESQKYYKGEKLNPAETKVAQAFHQGGLPQNMAILASKAKISSADREKLNQLTGSRYAVTKFKQEGRRGSGAKRLNSQSTSTGMDFNPADIFKNLQMAQEKTLSPAEKLEAYKRKRAQNRAVAMAEINPSENEPIFNIISQRYLKSGFIKIE